MAPLLALTLLCALPQQGDELEAGRWWVLGPFRSAQAPNTNLRLDPEKDFGDAQVDVPWSGLLEDYPRRTGGVLRWRLVALPVHERLAAVDPLAAEIQELGALLPELDAEELRPRGNAVYLYCSIDSDEAREVELHYGADGGLRMWLNGRQVAKDDKPRRFDPWSDRAELKLARGRNHLLVKLVHDGDPWRFAMGSATERAYAVRTALGGDTLLAGRPKLAARVNAAIDNGVEYLVDFRKAGMPAVEQRGYASRYPHALAAMTAYTLMRCGLEPGDETVSGLLDLVREPDREGTYSVALQAMAMALGGREQDREELQYIADWLVDQQQSDGLWAYPAGSTDLSNTQYAALGLQAAAEAGVEIPQGTWEQLTRGVLACRAPLAGGRQTQANSGFGYRAGAGGASWTMTAAGIATLVLCRERLDEGRLRDSCQAAIDNALDALGDGERLLQGNGYALYSLERVGGFLRRDNLGGRSWYLRGLELHLDDLEGKGWAKWSEKRGYGRELETCFMLLFLRRASSGGTVLKRPVTPSGTPEVEGLRHWKSDSVAGALVLRASLEGVPSMWLDATSPAFDDLQRVVYWVLPPDGKWERIDETDGRRYAAPLPCDRPGVWQLRASGFLADGKSVASGILEIPWPPGSADAPGKRDD